MTKSRLLLFVLSLSAAHALAETVQIKTARLRKTPFFLAAVVTDLAYLETVTLLQEQGAWARVKNARGLEGWVELSALSKASVSQLQKGGKVQLSKEGVALAGKGFSREYEESMKKSDKSLNYKRVDRVEALGATDLQVLELLRNGGFQAAKPVTPAKLAQSDGDTWTDEQEYYVGRTLSATVLTGNAPVDSDFNAYLNAIVRWLAAQSTRPTTYMGYRAALIEGDAPAALSTPGGFIYVTKPMIALLKSEDELAAILAHEIAHICVRDGEEAIQKADRDAQRSDIRTASKISEVSRVGGGLLKKLGGSRAEKIGSHLEKGGRVLGQGVDLRKDLWKKQFSKVQETSADRLALETLARAGYDGRDLIAFLRRQNEGKTMMELLKGAVQDFRSTHPLDARRIASAEASVRKWTFLGDKAARTKRFERAKAALGR
jgi:hypothetical protein